MEHWRDRRRFVSMAATTFTQFEYLRHCRGSDNQSLSKSGLRPSSQLGWVRRGALRVQSRDGASAVFKRVGTKS